MSRVHCPRCQRPQSHCLCPLIPRLASRTRVLILQHPDEVRHALNTARLAALGLCNAELRIGEHFPELEAELSGRQVWLLFPGAAALRVEALAGQACGEERVLIVPDGTWRKAPGPGALSTVEALVHCLNALEGQGRFDALLAPFEALIDGQIVAMGEEVFRRNHLRESPET